VLIGWVLPLAVCAQGPPFRQFKLQDGLPSLKIYKVVQDKDAMLWLCTDRGIARYDGTSFRNYTTQDGIPENVILTASITPQGHPLFASYHTKVFSVVDDEIIHHEPKEMTEGVYLKVPVSICMTEDSSIWTGIRNHRQFQLMRMDTRGKVGFLDESHPGHYGAIMVLEKNELVFGSSNRNFLREGVFVYNRDKSVKVKLTFAPEIRGEMGSSIKLGNGDILFSCGRILHILRDQEHRFIDIGLHADLGIYEDRKGNVFVPVVTGGVLVFRDYDFSHAVDTLLKDIPITQVLHDHEGGYWFSSLSEGLFYTSSLDIKTASTKRGGALPPLRYFVSKGRQYAMTTDGDLLSLKLDANRLKAQKIAELFNLEGKYGRLGIFSDSLICTCNKPLRDSVHRLYLLDLSSGQATWYPGFNCVLFQTIAGNQLLGFGRMDLFFLDLRDMGVKRVSLEKPHRWVAFVTHRGEQYLGDNEGLWVMRDSTMVRLASFDKWSSYPISGLASFGDSLAVATEGGGVILATGSDTSVISENNGLLNDYCSDVEITAEGVIWVSTTHGLTRIKGYQNHDRLLIRHFTGTHELFSNQIDQLEAVGQEIWAFSDEGFTILPQESMAEKTIPNVRIEKVSINDSVVEKDSLLTMKYGFGSLSFEFASNTFHDADFIRYGYRLLNMSDDWTWSAFDRVVFASLEPGEYVFQLKAMNEAGVETATTLSYAFIVEPPYWMTWWFRSIVILSFLLVVLLITRLQIRRLKRISRLKNDRLQSEQKALKALMTPHFIFNVINSILFLISQSENYKAEKALKAFARMVRGTLHLSQQEFISLEQEVKSVETYISLEQLRFDHQLNVQLSVEGVEDPSTISLPPMIIQPFIENAIVHGLRHKSKGEKQLHISFRQTLGLLHCTVEDNGIGRAAARMLRKQHLQEHNGQGVQISNERIALHNRISEQKIDLKIVDLTDAAGLALGTRVEILIDLEKE